VKFASLKVRLIVELEPGVKVGKNIMVCSARIC